MDILQGHLSPWNQNLLRQSELFLLCKLNTSRQDERRELSCSLEATLERADLTGTMLTALKESRPKKKVLVMDVRKTTME